MLKASLDGILNTYYGMMCPAWPLCNPAGSSGVLQQQSKHRLAQVATVIQRASRRPVGRYRWYVHLKATGIRSTYREAHAALTCLRFKTFHPSGG